MFKKSSTFIILTYFLIYIFETRATVVRSCDGLPAPIYVNVGDCEREPCFLAMGQIMKFDIAFNTTKYTDKLSQRAEVDIEGGANFEYSLFFDGCSMLVNGYCPIFKDEVLLYRVNFPLFGFPSITFTLTFSLLGDDDDIVSCFKAKLLT